LCRRYAICPTCLQRERAQVWEAAIPWIREALITEDGSLADVTILRSVALLDAAAVDAVRQGRYTPTLLNGIPVRVIMSVTVTFVLH
jgi:TonB family protein